jgi:hypothetical protein
MRSFALRSGVLALVAMAALSLFAQAPAQAPKPTAGAGSLTNANQAQGAPLQASYALVDPTLARRSQKGKVAPDAKPPRLPNGKVDLTGPWEPNAIGENVNLVGLKYEVPMNATAQKLYDARIGVLGKDDPEARCLPPGVPRLTTTPYPFRFVQTDNYIAIIYEGGSQTFRQIFLDGRKHSEFAEELWNGESIGHWEGDTLVVETKGFNDITWIDAAGVPHSKNMKVTERITRLDADNMEIVNIIDDPEMFTKQWSFTTYPKRLKGELLEYICNENEKDVQHMVGK